MLWTFLQKIFAGWQGNGAAQTGGPGQQGATGEDEWNDEARERLRENVRSSILGHVRLMKRGREDILQSCREWINDECPDDEWDAFVQFATDELKRAERIRAEEQADWPAETDCDRLDRVEEALRGKGIVLWQASPCCDTCTCGELGDRIDELEERDAGFRERVRGYSFFIDQNLPESLAESTEISVYLGYGWISPDGRDVAPEEYEKHALEIAREVCAALREEGFEVNWDGDFSRKIGLSLNWQRRGMLI